MSTRTFTFQVQSQQGATWLSGKPLNQWFEIPGTALSSCPPSLGTSTDMNHPTAAYNGIVGPAAKIVAWCGATLRPTGSVYLIAAAGGHGDYGGNEVNALVLNTPTPRWVELKASTPAVNAIDSLAVYLDLRRSSTHTYNTTQFVPQDDRLVILPYGAMGVSDLRDPTAEQLSLYPRRVVTSFKATNWTAASGGNDWDVAELAASTSTPRSGFYPPMPSTWTFAEFGQVGCSDALTGDLYNGDNAYGLWKYTRASGTWSKLNFALSAYGAAIAIDQTVRNGESFRRILAVGQNSSGIPGIYRNDTGAKLTMGLESGSLPWSVLDVGQYNGAMYDAHNDCFWAFVNGVDGNFAQYKVEYVTPTTYRITKVTVAPVSGSTVPNFVGRNGIHNSIQYVPELKGFVVADTYTGNVHFMRVG